jgi:hypothetical protein
MINGTYGFVYCGLTGVGIGAFTTKDGVLNGCDAGCEYTGSVSVDAATGDYIIDFVQHTPAGIELVQGVEALPWPSDRPRQIRLPPDFDGKPLSLALPPGSVTVIFKRMPDTAAPFARGFTITPKA